MHEGEHMGHMHSEAHKGVLRTYLPLILVLGTIGILDFVLLRSLGLVPWPNAMRIFMGLFFVVFGFFKLLDLKGFADAYAGYDIIAKRSRLYAFAYPFIELALGLLFLFDLFPFATNIATVVVMGVSSVGVIQVLAQHRTIQCACLGTVIKLPMSTITVIEDLGMGLMALITLLYM